MRSDHGTENVGIWRFMEEVRGRDHHSYIAGRSVHNTGIETLWRDVYTYIASTMFKFLVQWNNTEFLIQIIIVTSFAYTMFFYLELMPPYSVFKAHGIIILYLLRETIPYAVIHWWISWEFSV